MNVALFHALFWPQVMLILVLLAGIGATQLIRRYL